MKLANGQPKRESTIAESEKSTAEQRSRRRAAKAGLWYVDDFSKGISRRRCGRGFTYLTPSGRTLRSQRTRSRIQSLTIPPAWEEVWICPRANGHIQARGKDDAGRWQYIYHPHWQAVSTATKFDRMHRFAEVLPRIRRRVRRDLNRGRLSKQRVLAAVVRLLDRGQLRVGGTQSNQARGATTLEEEHVAIDGFRVSLDFPGKSGQRREVEFRDRKVVRVIQQCQELDGEFLFGYLDQRGKECQVASTDVNEYLFSIAKERVTAKDFRTWWGSVAALAKLTSLAEEDSPAGRRRQLRAAIQEAASTLGNSVAVCRDSYVHPGMQAAVRSGELPAMLDDVRIEPTAELTQDEIRFAALLPQLEFT